MSREQLAVGYRGAIAWMANNPVASNLLMIVIMAAGLFGMFSVTQEVFPSFELDTVTISVPYPGASPAEVEQGIVLAIEEKVRGIDGIKRVTSTANENVGTVAAELLIDANPEKVLSDIKTEVDRIQTFPEEAEEPSVTLLSPRREVISLVIAGDQDLRRLHEIGERARRDLLASGEITQVELFGVPPLEIAVEVRRETLEAYGLTLDDIARTIRASSLELPGGSLDTRGGELLVRVADRKLSGEEFGDIVVATTAGGAQTRLGQIATIRDGFEDNDQASYFNGQPAVRVTAYRVGDETPQSVADAVKDYAEVLSAEVGESVTITHWADDSELLKGRIDLLLNNARLGLILVVGVLALFLNARLAFWVSMGIPITFLGAFFLMPSLDVTINMVSLFAFIITLGLVVDDAIVVGESAFAKMEEGMEPLEASIAGARQMVVPVTFAVLTSAAAFSPLFFVPGFSGKIFRVLPMIVLAVLFFSLVESFFILPAHLAHQAKGNAATRRLGVLLRPLDWARGHATAGLARFISGVFEPFLRFVLRWRYAAASFGVATFIATIGMLAGGVVPFNFFPKLDSDQVTATVRLPYGTPIERTLEIREVLEASAARTIEELGAEDAVVGMFTSVGSGPAAGGPGGGTAAIGSHLLTVELELVGSGEREFTSSEFGFAWAAQTPEQVGVDAMGFTSSSGPGAGAAVDVLMSHPDTEVLAAASAEMAAELRSFSDLTDVENSYANGKPQLDFQLKDSARALGLTTSDVARQLRSSFYGSEALREQRGRNELKVMVRLPEEQRSSEYDLDALEVRTPMGAYVPLEAVADVTRGRAPTAITREEGTRTVNVKGELAAGVASPQAVLEGLEEGAIPKLLDKYPGLSMEFAGSQREQAESLGSLGRNYLLALFVMYALLAVPFKSYLQPLVIMTAIPFGFVGAVWGHLIMGYEMSIISMMGVVALSGVVINDSLVLIDAANQRRRLKGDGLGHLDDAIEAIVHGATRRFRPILLTSLTTFFGLAPMIAETSVQARFLIPMAISLGFGVLFATFVVLVLVPCFYLFVEDFLYTKTWYLRWSGLVEADPVEVELEPAK